LISRRTPQPRGGSHGRLLVRAVGGELEHPKRTFAACSCAAPTMGLGRNGVSHLALAYERLARASGFFHLKRARGIADKSATPRPFATFEIGVRRAVRSRRLQVGDNENGRSLRRISSCPEDLDANGILQTPANAILTISARMKLSSARRKGDKDRFSKQNALLID